jgi:hypothetical protein
MKKLTFLLVLLIGFTTIFAQSYGDQAGIIYKKRNATGEIKIIPGATSAITLNSTTSITSDGTTIRVKVGTTDKLVINGNTTYVLPMIGAKVGATAGWVVNAGNNISLATLPASQTSSTLILPINFPFKVGATITGFSVIGQIESAGGAVTLTAELRKHTAAAADVADASIAGLASNVSVTADAILSATNAVKTGLTEVVAADETFYLLITATTAGSTDIALQGITLTVTQ